MELTLKENQKFITIKKLVETNGNKERAKIKLGLKSIRQITRLIAGYKVYGKDFFVHGNRGRKPKHALSAQFKDEIELLYTSKYFDWCKGNPPVILGFTFTPKQKNTILFRMIFIFICSISSNRLVMAP